MCSCSFAALEPPCRAWGAVYGLPYWPYLQPDTHAPSPTVFGNNGARPLLGPGGRADPNFPGCSLGGAYGNKGV